MKSTRPSRLLLCCWLGACSPAAELPPEPDAAPDFYVDYDETGPYEAETGESECAT